MEEKDIRIRSEEVKDILTAIPNWIIRWGNAIILLVFIGFLAVSYWVKYPDVIISRVTISTENLPVKITPQFTGKVAQVFVENNQQVSESQSIALLENSARYEDIQKIQHLSQAFQRYYAYPDSLIVLNFPQEVQLGELQNAYTQFQKVWQEYVFFVEAGYYSEKVNQLRKQIQTYGELQEALVNQQNIRQDKKNLEAKRLEAYSDLVADSLVAPLQFDEMQKQFLDEGSQLENVKIARLQANLETEEFRRQLLNLQENYELSDSDLQQRLQRAFLELNGQLARWEEKYLLRSPIAGELVFLAPLRPQKLVNPGENLFSILPREQSLQAFAFVSSQGYGKIEAGQKVKIRLDAFPYEEFGLVEGTIKEKAEVSKDGQYWVKIELAQGLETNQAQKLEFSQEMQGEAHILTKERRLLIRISHQLVKFWED